MYKLKYVKVRDVNGQPIFVHLEKGWDTTNCKSYEDLPEDARTFIELIEHTTGLPVKYIGIGADNANTIVC